MHYYDFNIGDYAKKTRHLSNEEDLAYRRALDLYYDTEKPLDVNNIPLLARQMRVSVESMQAVVDEFFHDGMNKHADEKINAYYAYIEKQASNGRLGGRPKKPTDNPPLNDGKPTDNPVPSQPLPTTHYPLPNIQGKSKDLSPPLASTVKKGTRLPDDWVLPKAWGEWALSENPELTVVDVRTMADTFRDHWIANANQAKGKKSDWLATWRNWVRNQKPKPVNFNRVQEARLDWTDQLFGRNKNGNGGQIRDITPVSADQSNGESLSENVLGVWERDASEMAGD